MAEQPSYSTTKNGKRLIYIDGVGWRYATEHLELSPLGIKVKESLERMPQVEPKIELVCYSIMPNHIHFIIAVRGELSRPIGTIIRSFMGATSHSLHMLKAEGKIRIHSLEYSKPSARTS